MSLPLTPELLSDLIGLIYDAAIDPSHWRVTIEAIRTALGFENAAFALQALPSGEVLLNLTSNIPAGYVERMGDYGSDVVDQWGGPERFGALPMDQPAVLSHVNPEAVSFDITTNRYSQEWARPQGLIDVLTMGLARDGNGLGTLSFGRHERQGDIGEREIEAARLLMPHLQRATTINRLLDMASFVRTTFTAALDSFSVPVILTTGGLQIVHANPPALALFDDAELVQTRDGLLSARSAAVSSALAVAVTQATRDESAIGRKGLGIPMWEEDRLAGALHVLPLRPERHRSSADPLAAVFVARTNTPFIAPTDLVAELFGLTPAEARVFEQIAAGRTVMEASDMLGIGESTVRTHLLRLFEKTGTRRQAELVHLAASLAVPIETRRR